MNRERRHDERRPFVIANHKIRANELRVLTDDGEQLGIMNKNEAQDIANEKQLDLILIVPNAQPPVAKIISLNKYNYEIKKRDKERAKQARLNSVETKEVKFRPAIGDNDFKMKSNQIQRFINKGSKVKVTIQMRGRENAKAKEVLDHFSSQFSEYLSGFKYDAPLKLTGNRIIGMIVKNEKQQ
tara:strand:+ start:492 stop:1043 length:552 start_codon:yes stop_codon:yes gene_type:complete